ncbi:chromosomal replication initiator protein DnaA [Chloroflexota bacterium]
MTSKTAQEIWEAALGQLQIQISKSNYRTWFEKTVGLNYQEDEFIIGVPNTFVAEYLERNQRSLIEKALIGFTSPNIQVVFQVNGRLHDLADMPGEKSAIASAAQGHSGFNPNYVFDSFIEGSSNSLARAAALGVAQNSGHSYNPLFIYGGVGLGKTHLLHAIGHMARANRMTVICVSAEPFTNEFITAIREKKTEEFHNRYRNADMLLVDDIQFISGKEQTEESFFHTFNELHNANRQVVITNDRHPKQMTKLSERLRSRFEWGLIVDIQPPDLATRLAILQAKATEREANLSSEVLEFIAEQKQQNIRELEGSLNRVIAFAKLLSATPTVELAAKAIESIASRKPKDTPTAPERIMEAVAEVFQLTPTDLRSQKRDKETALARRMAMYFLRQETSYPLAKVGQEIGGRDAAAVANASKKITSEAASSQYLRRKITEIQQKIHNTPQVSKQ